VAPTAKNDCEVIFVYGPPLYIVEEASGIEKVYTYFMISDRNNCFKEMPEDKMSVGMFSLE
jgi:hypothetical protein